VTAQSFKKLKQKLTTKDELFNYWILK